MRKGTMTARCVDWSGLPFALAALSFTACVGAVADSASDDGESAPPGATPVPGAAPAGAPRGGPGGAAAGPAQTTAIPKELAALSGLRRLTSDEYDNVLRDLLSDNARSSDLVLPEDLRNPFDNDFTAPGQLPSRAVVEGVELLARDAAARLTSDPARRDAVVGCKAADAGCLQRFVTRFGRRALRRPLADDEVQRLVAFAQTTAAGDFNVAVETVVRVMLQDPEFLYRVEIGTPVAPGLVKLTPFEVASRLSFLLWGSGPDDALLDRAAKGALETAAQVGEAATAMLADGRARERVGRFHAMWMGYETMSGAADLAPAMKAETAALLGRVIFDEKRPWKDLLRSTETYVNYTLAKNYGLQMPATLTPTSGATKFAWVAYDGTKRRGLLSQGSFLSLGSKFGDTSPTLRGKAIRERLFCQEIPPPPPGVNVDDPPQSASPCKWDRYQVHSTGGCAGCHGLMDPVGFGLERYDAQGRVRTYDKDPSTGKDLTQCAIRAEGNLDGKPFSGPAELEDLMLASPLLNACVVTQLYRFTVGRAQLDDVDQRLVTALTGRLGDKDFRFDELLLDLVSSPAFVHRRVGN
jgi:hypothetical protein